MTSFRRRGYSTCPAVKMNWSEIKAPERESGDNGHCWLWVMICESKAVHWAIEFQWENARKLLPPQCGSPFILMFTWSEEMIPLKSLNAVVLKGLKRAKRRRTHQPWKLSWNRLFAAHNFRLSLHSFSADFLQIIPSVLWCVCGGEENSVSSPNSSSDQRQLQSL